MSGCHRRALVPIYAKRLRASTPRYGTTIALCGIGSASSGGLMSPHNHDQAPETALRKLGSRRRASARRGLGLGVFSVGLGLAQLLAPASVASLIGVPNQPRT